MLIYQPGERFFWAENLWPGANDGGQRMDSSRYWTNSIQVESGPQPSRITRSPMRRKRCWRGSSTSLASAGSREATSGSFHRNFRIGMYQPCVEAQPIFNHPLLSPDQSDSGGAGGAPFALLGDFNVQVDQATGKLLPIAESDITRNPNFGRLFQSFSQEGVDSRRSVRIRLRITI
jgi:hypothetical protein